MGTKFREFRSFWGHPRNLIPAKFFVLSQPRKLIHASFYFEPIAQFNSHGTYLFSHPQNLIPAKFNNRAR